MLKGEGDVSSSKDGGPERRQKPFSTLFQLCNGKCHTLHGESHCLPKRFDDTLFQISSEIRHQLPWSQKLSFILYWQIL